MNKSYDHFRVLSKEMRPIWLLAIIFTILSLIISISQNYLDQSYFACVIWYLFSFIVFIVCFFKNYKIIQKLNLEVKIFTQLEQIIQLIMGLILVATIYHNFTNPAPEMDYTPSAVIVLYFFTMLSIEIYKYIHGDSSSRKILLWTFVNYGFFIISPSFFYVVITTFILPYIRIWVQRVCNYSYFQIICISLLAYIIFTALISPVNIVINIMLIVCITVFAFILQKIMNIQQQVEINLLYPTLLFVGIAMLGIIDQLEIYKLIETVFCICIVIYMERVRNNEIKY